MGDMADYCFELALEQEIDDSLYKISQSELLLLDPEGARKEVIWTTKKGSKIPIGQLTDRHLNNCIRLLERKEAQTNMLELLKNEKKFRKFKKKKQCPNCGSNWNGIECKKCSFDMGFDPNWD